jgi:multiple sugar transport system substrate-binding protein
MRRLLVITAAVCALLGSGATLAQTEVRVVVAHYSDQTAPIFEGMAADFEKNHPDIDIQIEDVNWDVLEQKLTTDIAGARRPTSRSSAPAGWSATFRKDWSSRSTTT